MSRSASAELHLAKCKHPNLEGVTAWNYTCVESSNFPCLNVLYKRGSRRRSSMKIKNLCLQQRPTVKQPIGDSDRMIQQWIFQLGQGTPNERLAGVSGLSALMSSSRPEQRSEAEVALSNAIAIEASQTVRHAIVSSFANLDPKIVGPAELDKVISLLAQESRGLVLEGDLWCNRSFGLLGPRFRRCRCNTFPQRRGSSATCG